MVIIIVTLSIISWLLGLGLCLTLFVYMCIEEANEIDYEANYQEENYVNDGYDIKK